MIVEIYISILGYIFEFVMYEVNLLLAPFNFLAITVPTGFGYLFGNVFLLNDFLPVTEMFVLFALAVSFKTALVGYKAFLFFTFWIRYVKQTFITFRS